MCAHILTFVLAQILVDTQLLTSKKTYMSFLITKQELDRCKEGLATDYNQNRDAEVKSNVFGALDRAHYECTRCSQHE
ncbi:hypothetical protein ACTXT7_004948 [Hymenolepis weldensis]